MELTKPVLNRQQFLKTSGINSTTFNNWRIRGLVPLSDLGCKYEKLTRCKYSYLAAAYCACLTYHKGKDRKQYIELLKTTFSGIAKDGDYSPHDTIVISNYGTGTDCGLFFTEGDAYLHGGDRSAYVPLGQIIRKAQLQVDSFLENERQKIT